MKNLDKLLKSGRWIKLLEKLNGLNKNMLKAFEKLQKMNDENMNIRLASLSNIISTRISPKGGIVEIAVDTKTAQEIMIGKEFVGGLLLADKKEFDSIE